jgi:hypothetical protein
MLSITQVKKANFAADSKIKHTPSSKTLGRVQTLILPCEELQAQATSDDVQGILLREASKLACRVAVLNGDAALNKCDCSEKVIAEDDLRHFLEHALPIVSENVRAQIVTKDCEEKSGGDDACVTCHFRQDATNGSASASSSSSSNGASATLIHEWSQDQINKFVYNMHNREHHHVVFTHPCCRGNIEMQISAASTQQCTPPQAPPSADALRVCAAKTFLLGTQQKNSAPFLTELIDKISRCQTERPLSSESIEQRVDRMRVERIALQEQARHRQLQEYDELIRYTRMNLGSKQKQQKEETQDDEEKEEDSLLSTDELSLTQSYTDSDASDGGESKVNNDDDGTENEGAAEDTEPVGNDAESDAERCSFLFAHRMVKAATKRSSIYVVGEFNDWEVSENYKMKELGTTGVHVLLASLLPGEYLYCFVANGAYYVDDTKPKYCDATNEEYNVCKVEPNKVVEDIKSKKAKEAGEDETNTEEEEEEEESSTESDTEESDGSSSDTDSDSSSDSSSSNSNSDAENEEEAEDEEEAVTVDEGKQDEADEVEEKSNAVEESEKDSDDTTSSDDSDDSSVESQDNQEEAVKDEEVKEEEVKEEVDSDTQEDSGDKETNDEEPAANNKESESHATDASVVVATCGATLDSVVREEYPAESQSVKQFCADFMLAICEAKDEFAFFAKLNCPFILQWTDNRRNAVHVFRRYYSERYSWTFSFTRTTHFQLIATLRACN